MFLKQTKTIAIVTSLIIVAGASIAFAQQVTTTITSGLPPAARFSGIISNISRGSLTLTSGSGKSVTVSQSSNPTILVNEEPTSWSALANGMQSSVYGTWSGGTSTISATLINADSAVFGGIVTNSSGSNFTITSGTHSVAVNPSGNAAFIINRVPTAALSVAVGMTATAYGAWTDQTKSAITASAVTANYAGASGRVGKTNGNQFVVVDGNGKQITINLSGSTDILKSGVLSSVSAIVDGAPIATYGFWTNSNQSTLNANTVYLYGNGMEASSTGGWCYTFYRNLRVGAQGPDVYNLQTALSQNGFSVPSTGSFDQTTASAVTGFQEKYASIILTPNSLTYGTGYVGPSTRGELNALYGCANPINPPGNGNDGYDNGRGSGNGGGWQQ